MEITIIIMLVIGMALMITCLVLIKKDEKNMTELNHRIDDAFSTINSSIEMIDNNTTEFNQLCELVFSEIDGKYQELLTLYSLIEEQKKQGVNIQTDSLNANVKQNKKSKQNKNNKTISASKNYDDSFIYKHKNAKEIFKLYDSGMNQSDIAKKLSMGTGEVQLILNFRKG